MPDRFLLHRAVPLAASLAVLFAGFGNEAGAAPALVADAAPVTSAVTAPGPDPELLRLRERAWRAWFAGDEGALRELLPPEFIGLDMGDGPFSDLATTVEEAREFRANGGRLVQLDFPETRSQAMGDVVVFYGRFAIELAGPSGNRKYAGRLTEVFVKRDGRWWHPGWHLDLASPPESK